MDAYRLGMGEPLPISAETGDGMIDLCAALMPFIDRASQQEEKSSDSESSAMGRLSLGLQN